MATDVEVINKLEAVPPASEPVEKPAVPPVAEPAKEPGAQPTPEEKPAEGVPTDEPEVEPDLDEPAKASGDFEKFKPVFDSHPELKSELKQIIGREQAFSELGTFSEVKGIVERIPTLEDAEQLVAQADSAKALGETFRGDLPAFVESLKESDPLAFKQAMETLPEVLAQTDPAAYTAQSRYYMTATLDYLFQHGQGNAEFLQALGTVASVMGINLGVPRQTSMVDPEKQKLREQLAERERQDAEAEFGSFWEKTDGAIINGSVELIESQLKTALPSASEKQLSRMVKEVWAKTLEVLNGQPQTTAQIERFKQQAQNGRRGIAEHKSIIAYGIGRAKLVIPKQVKAVVDEWTKELLATNKSTVDKKKAVAQATRDVGAGPQGTSSSAAGPATPGKRRTEEDVFRELESRTYVAR